MSELISTIKELAHQVSENYLLEEKDMNESLVDLYREGKIENEDVLKRICENANQNVYLALFNDQNTNKSNIVFDMADSEMVLNEAKDSEESMNNYNTPPEDFRSALEIAIISDEDAPESEGEKLASLGMAVEYRQVLKNLLSKVENIKTASEYNAENAFNRMAYDTKVLVSKGDSIGDISKIATRYVKEHLEGDFMKTAKCYDIIHKEMVKSGFHVKTGFTKLSSQRINYKSDVLKPVHEFATSLAKIAGSSEMIENLQAMIKVFDKNINAKKD